MAPSATRSPSSREEVLALLLPCVRFPQLGEKLLDFEANEELMAVPGVRLLVSAAFRSLAFPKAATAAPDPLQTVPRVGCACWDEVLTHTHTHTRP